MGFSAILTARSFSAPEGSTRKSTTPTTARGKRSRCAALTICGPSKARSGSGVRGYRDTWDIKSGTLELEAEKYIFPWLRVRAGGRFYRQTAAVFWSDDYTGGEPRSRSARTVLVGRPRAVAVLELDARGARARRRGWPKSSASSASSRASRPAVGFDILFYNYSDFTLAGQAPLDTRAYIGSLSLTALF